MGLQKIQTIDNGLDALFKEFTLIASSVAFDIVGDLFDDGLIEKQTYPGIYYIELNTAGKTATTLEQWLADFQQEWMDEQYRNQFVANPQKKRIKIHKNSGVLLPWMPVYIGKSKNVGQRLHQHVHFPLKQRTFSMKLGCRPTMMTRAWRVSTIDLSGIVNYDVIAPKLETAMRNKYHPIVGR